MPLAPEDREKTAFRAPQGLFQFVRMPFGMSTAPSSFARMMRELERFSAVTCFDDILVATETWEQHLQALGGLLSALEEHGHGLTARPSKLQVGFLLPLSFWDILWEEGS